MSIRIIILAAGKSKRMKSEYTKLAHNILGVPMVGYILECASAINNDGISVVLGNDSDTIRSVTSGFNVEYVVQKQQLGTGHAVKTAAEKYPGYKGSFLVLNGDLPAMTSKTLKNFIRQHEKKKSVFSFISSEIPDPSGYGRVIRDDNDNPLEIVEDKDATPAQKRSKEINSGAYCIDARFLSDSIDDLGTGNSQGEYYLPALLNIAVKKGLETFVYKTDDSAEILGVNTRRELAEIQGIIKERVNERHMYRGVTITDPATTYISPEAVIGRDTVIHPNTHIYGKTRIGSNCTLGPSCYIEDSRIGNNTNIRFSTYVSGSVLRNNINVGPFAHLRPETEIMDEAKIGNFVETKKSRIGKGSKVPHLSYVGDASVGKSVNIGAGSITCNYDGVAKNRTVIGDGAFIGSDTMMVAPVKIGKNATTAAGSTITSNVTDGSLAIERSKQKEIKGWHSRKIKKEGKS